jgi:hypothetical protein
LTRMVTEGERITQAARLERIETSLDYLAEQVRELIGEVKKTNECLGSHSIRIAVLEGKAETNKGEIDKLRTRDTNGGILNAILAVAAGIIGIFIKP